MAVDKPPSSHIAVENKMPNVPKKISPKFHNLINLIRAGKITKHLLILLTNEIICAWTPKWEMLVYFCHDSLLQLCLETISLALLHLDVTYKDSLLPSKREKITFQIQECTWATIWNYVQGGHGSIYTTMSPYQCNIILHFEHFLSFYSI